MALKSGLTLYCYTLPTSASGLAPVIVAYTDELLNLTFTTVDPGGFGQLTVTLNLSNTDSRLPQPQLGLFSHCALVGGWDRTTFCAFRGEIMQATINHSAQQGDYISITALGVGNQLRDDPYNASYKNQTAQQVVKAELTRHTSTNAYWNAISTDASQIFPDNPATTSSPTYDGRQAEEIILDQMSLNGDYSFGVWDDPNQRDAAGFPLGRIEIVQRDTSTTHYQASLLGQDITAYTITEDSTRAYNFIEVVYSNASGGITLYAAKDSRLAANYAQNTAPFRARKIRRDLSSITTIGSTQAAQIATVYLNQFENVSNKVKLTLSAVRDALGNDIPLHQVRAGKNIFVPDMAVRGATLPTSPTARVNQFYIVQTTYTETQTDISLVLQCDNYSDDEARLIARLTLAADQKARGLRYAQLIAPAGAPEVGACGLPNVVASGAGVLNSATVKFTQHMATTPTSITLTSSSATNISGVAAGSITALGFLLSGTSAAAGNCSWSGTYATNGNTLHRVHRRRGRFDWHCSRCDTLHRGLGLRKHLIADTGREGVGPVLAVACPACGMVESFNTALGPEHEDAQRYGAHHAEQAALIRELAAATGVTATGMGQ